jgi:signal transduction histidine kinase
MAPQRFRRRFLLAAVGILATLLAIGFAIGASVKGGGGPPWSGPDDRRGGPFGPLAFAGFIAVVGGGATFLAYRRLSRPFGHLLGATERVAEGRYDVHVTPDGPRELRSVISTFNDMAARLAASDEQRRGFLAEITHELRTPLAVLQSGIEAQVDGIHPRDDAHLQSLLEETQLLARLVDDLHTLALSDAGRLALHYERSSPAALVEDAIGSASAAARRAGIDLTASLPRELPEIDVDPTRIRQVLANLLSNALRHTPAGGTVRVSVAASGAEVRFTVTDSGPGIPEDQLAYVFDRFTRSPDSRGSGLGLSIARDLVEAHGGTIAAANEPAGGATIIFAVPVEGSGTR